MLTEGYMVGVEEEENGEVASGFERMTCGYRGFGFGFEFEADMVEFEYGFDRLRKRESLDI
jgi:hypothetical protein